MKLEGINGSTKVYGIVGDPISAVRSPELFNAIFSKENINAVFIPIHVGKSDMATVWAGLKSIQNLAGIVVTMPHKSSVAQLIDELGETGKFLGSVNAVRRESDGRWIGDMFDGHGFVDGLRAEGHDPQGWKVSLHGLGGAGCAIAYALARARVSSICLNDVNKDQIVKLMDQLQAEFPEIEICNGNSAGICLDAEINATPLGMNADDPLPFDPKKLPATTLVVDVITKPEITPLLHLAMQTGHRVHTGKHMHLGQARMAARFFGFEQILNINKS